MRRAFRRGPIWRRGDGCHRSSRIRTSVDGLLAVEEDQPHGVAIQFFPCAVSAQLVGDGHQQAGRRRSVVGADEVDVAQRIVGLVMGAKDNHAVFLAGKTHDEVVHGHRADRGVGGEGIVFKLIVLEVVFEELLGF